MLITNVISNSVRFSEELKKAYIMDLKDSSLRMIDSIFNKSSIFAIYNINNYAKNVYLFNNNFE